MPLDSTPIVRDFDRELLPPNRTPYERAISAGMRLGPEFWAAARKVGDVKRDLLDETLPFLIYEYGLEPVVPWVNDLRTVLREGRDWQRIRGTPDAIRKALSWIGVSPEQIEESPDDTWWDLFQLALSAPVTDQHRLEAIIELTRLSRPAHTDVIRIYNSEWDVRALRWGVGRWGENLVGDWSGVWLREDWPKVSFGRRNAARLQIATGGINAPRSIQHRWATLEHMARGFRWGVHRWASDQWQTERILPRFAAGIRGHRRAGMFRLDLRRTDWPTGPWPDGPWFGSDAAALASGGYRRRFAGRSFLPLALLRDRESRRFATRAAWDLEPSPRGARLLRRSAEATLPSLMTSVRGLRQARRAGLAPFSVFTPHGKHDRRVAGFASWGRAWPSGSWPDGSWTNGVRFDVAGRHVHST